MVKRFFQIPYRALEQNVKNILEISKNLISAKYSEQILLEKVETILGKQNLFEVISNIT